MSLFEMIQHDTRLPRGTPRSLRVVDMIVIAGALKMQAQQQRANGMPGIPEGEDEDDDDVPDLVEGFDENA
jgi:hypothetical protein